MDVVDAMNKTVNIMEHTNLSNYFLVKECCRHKTILDAACGDGAGSAILAKSGARKVVAVDLNVRVINQAKADHHYDNLEFFVANIEQIDSLFTDEKFDIIISNHSIEHLINTKRFLTGLKNLLSSNGILILSCSNQEAIQDATIQPEPYSISQFLQESQAIFGRPSRVFHSYPAYGVVNVDETQDAGELLNGSYTAPKLLQSKNSLACTVIYDSQQVIRPNAALHLIDFSEWNHLVAYDYSAEIKKNRLIFELEQRALMAQALIIENEVLCAKLDTLAASKVSKWATVIASFLKKKMQLIGKTIFHNKAFRLLKNAINFK